MSNPNENYEYYKQNALTKEELKKHKGFETKTDEELEEHLSGIRRLASVFLNIYLKQYPNEPTPPKQIRQRQRSQHKESSEESRDLHPRFIEGTGGGESQS